MALSLILTGIISSADELRREIGGPTVDTADPGYVSDEMLEAIIQRHHDEAVKLAEKAAGISTSKLQAPGPQILFEHVPVTMSASTDEPGLLEGDIPQEYYPWALRVEDDQGRGLTYDENITRTVRSAFVARYVYKIVGYKIYTNPEIAGEGTISTVNVELALANDLFDHLIDGEILNKINESIIRAGREMLASRIREGMRLEQVYGPDDGVIGDMS
jgi:hypothetical protein